MAEQLDIYGGSTPYRRPPSRDGRDDAGLQDRTARMLANRNHFASMRTRLADSDSNTSWSREKDSPEAKMGHPTSEDGWWLRNGYDEDGNMRDSWHHPRLNPEQFHPQTGLPAEGEIDPESLGLHTFAPQSRAWGRLPLNAKYGNHFQSARRQVGTYAEIPVQRFKNDQPAVITPQGEVSAQRINGMLTAGETRRSERFPKNIPTDLPLVWHGTGNLEEHNPDPMVVLDGNHRVSSAIHQNQMFQPAHVFSYDSLDALHTHTQRQTRLRSSSTENPNRNPTAEYDAARRVYGTDIAEGYHLTQAIMARRGRG